MYWSYEISKLVIYGASDDLIEIEGVVNDEFYTDATGDDTVLVVGLTNGGVIEVAPFINEKTGNWNAIIDFHGRMKEWRHEVIKRPGTDDGGDYGIMILFPDDEKIAVFKGNKRV